MRWLLFISLIYPLQLFADCTFKNGRKTISIPESTRVSLFDAGKSLDNHKVQDQDGLGTCYANSTSALLKSVLPGKPDISYSHAAISSATQSWGQKKESKRKYIVMEDDKTKDFTSGGNICDSIAGMKKTGGACPKNLSILEGKEHLDSVVQVRLLEGLGKYFDGLNQIKKDPVALNKLKQDLAVAFELVNLEAVDLRAACLARKNEPFPSRKALNDLLTFVLKDYLAKPNPCHDERVKRLKVLLGPKAVAKKDRVSVDPSPEAQMKISKQIEMNKELKEAAELVISESALNGTHLEKASVILAEELNVLFSQLIGPDQEDAKCDTSEAHFLLGEDPLETARNFLIDMRKEKKADCQMNFAIRSSKASLLDLNEHQACLNQDQFDSMLGGILPLSSIGTSLDQKLLTDLINPDSLYANQLTNILMPGCLEKKNLIDISKVSCETLPLCTESQFGPTTNGVSGVCFGMEKAKAILRNRAIEEINLGVALGISVCTDFFDDPTVKTDFCRKQKPEDYSFHGMAISGYRCQDGKLEYELLNSWGSYCPADENNKNEILECELNADQMPNGRFWIKEEALIDSTNEITSVKLRK